MNLKNARVAFNLPAFETSPQALRNTTEKLIERAKAAYEQIGLQPQSNLSFATTVAALDDLRNGESLVMSRIYLLQNVSEDPEIRKVAEECVVKLQEFFVEKAYDPKVYIALKGFAKTAEAQKLSGEEKKLLEEDLRSSKRLGLDLPQEKQDALKNLQKELSQIETVFSTNINEYKDELLCREEDLKGLPDQILKGFKRNEAGLVRVTLEYPDYHPVMEFVESEEIRKNLLIKKYNIAKDTNLELLNRMIEKRDEMAELLGYSSFNDYVIEERMAKSSANVQAFLKDFEKKLRSKANIEFEELKKLKAEFTKNPDAKIYIWDYYFYSSLYKKMKFSVDLSVLREFFPLEKVMEGMFGLIQKLFGLRFEEVRADFVWSQDIRLIKVFDSKSNELMGAFYLDLYPREGKYGHAAAFTLIEGKLLKDGTYQAPVSAMVCNFPKTKPNLLSHGEVETFFHEFGHILHNILSRVRFSRFAGTNVAHDFVEAPSQVLENWVWDYKILQMISKHYLDDQKSISKDLVDKMNQAKKAGSAMAYLRQLSFAKADLEMHSKGRKKNANEIMDRVSAETFLEHPPGTVMVAGFGHMVGYASGYYGYSWADVMAADIFSLFKKAGLLSEELGLRLRKEIYESGSARDEKESLEAFLGRPLSQEAFFEDLGLAS